MAHCEKWDCWLFCYLVAGPVTTWFVYLNGIWPPRRGGYWLHRLSLGQATPSCGSTTIHSTSLTLTYTDGSWKKPVVLAELRAAEETKWKRNQFCSLSSSYSCLWFLRAMNWMNCQVPYGKRLGKPQIGKLAPQRVLSFDLTRPDNWFEKMFEKMKR